MPAASSRSAGQSPEPGGPWSAPASSTSTDAPASASRPATTAPAVPAPTTITSGVPLIGQAYARSGAAPGDAACALPDIRALGIAFPLSLPGCRAIPYDGGPTAVVSKGLVD